MGHKDKEYQTLKDEELERELVGASESNLRA